MWGKSARRGPVKVESGEWGRWGEACGEKQWWRWIAWGAEGSLLVQREMVADRRG